jgi:hypothetical protein
MDDTLVPDDGEDKAISDDGLNDESKFSYYYFIHLWLTFDLDTYKRIDSSLPDTNTMRYLLTVVCLSFFFSFR